MDEKASDRQEISNAEIAHLLDQAVIRFQNWRVETELNPNPRMVHSLANIMSIIDALTDISGRRMQYSYKALVVEMARLTDQTAKINNRVVESLADDNVSSAELQRITDGLVGLVNSAAGMIRLLQESFSNSEARTAPLLEAPPLDASLPAARKAGGRAKASREGKSGEA